MKIEKLYAEIEFEAEIDHYSPERPAPFCRNPSDPKYSDPGDSEECEYRLFFIVMSEDGKPIKKELTAENMEDFIAQVYKELDEEVREHVREEYEILRHGEL